jgi:hypothetical protein
MKLTITTLVIVEGSYIQGMENSLEEHPGKAYQELVDQAEEMITQYTCYYNAIKRWESNHKKTEILHQLEISKPTRTIKK